MLQFYSATAFRYESLYLGFIERMYVSPDVVDAELAYSHDGWDWLRTRPRRRFIEWGKPGAWDSAWLNVGTGGPIEYQGNLWFYYSGRAGAHGAKAPHNFGHIGLATLRVDGFASLQAKESPAWVETPPMRWPGGDLLVNVDCRRSLLEHYGACTGELRVEVRDARGRMIPGYESDACDLIRRNTGQRGAPARVPVTWKGGKRGMDALKRRKVRLVFHMRDAHLYAFQAGRV